MKKDDPNDRLFVINANLNAINICCQEKFVVKKNLWYNFQNSCFSGRDKK